MDKNWEDHLIGGWRKFLGQNQCSEKNDLYNPLDFPHASLKLDSVFIPGKIPNKGELLETTEQELSS